MHLTVVFSRWSNVPLGISSCSCAPSLRATRGGTLLRMGMEGRSAAYRTEYVAQALSRDGHVQISPCSVYIQACYGRRGVHRGFCQVRMPHLDLEHGLKEGSSADRFYQRNGVLLRPLLSPAVLPGRTRLLAYPVRHIPPPSACEPSRG